MTAAELKEAVKKKFREGQEINITVCGESGQKKKTFRVIIDKFYPAHVSVVHKGHKESFSYLELWQGASAVMGRPSKRSC